MRLWDKSCPGGQGVGMKLDYPDDVMVESLGSWVEEQGVGTDSSLGSDTGCLGGFFSSLCCWIIPGILSLLNFGTRQLEVARAWNLSRSTMGVGLFSILGFSGSEGSFLALIRIILLCVLVLLTLPAGLPGRFMSDVEEETMATLAPIFPGRWTTFSSNLLVFFSSSLSLPLVSFSFLEISLTFSPFSLQTPEHLLHRTLRV